MGAEGAGAMGGVGGAREGQPPLQEARGGQAGGGGSSASSPCAAKVGAGEGLTLSLSPPAALLDVGALGPGWWGSAGKEVKQRARDKEKLRALEREKELQKVRGLDMLVKERALEREGESAVDHMTKVRERLRRGVGEEGGMQGHAKQQEKKREQETEQEKQVDSQHAREAQKVKQRIHQEKRENVVSRVREQRREKEMREERERESTRETQGEGLTCSEAPGPPEVGADPTLIRTNIYAHTDESKRQEGGAMKEKEREEKEGHGDGDLGVQHVGVQMIERGDTPQITTLLHHGREGERARTSTSSRETRTSLEESLRVPVPSKLSRFDLDLGHEHKKNTEEETMEKNREARSKVETAWVVEESEVETERIVQVSAAVREERELPRKNEREGEAVGADEVQGMHSISIHSLAVWNGGGRGSGVGGEINRVLGIGQFVLGSAAGFAWPALPSIAALTWPPRAQALTLPTASSSTPCLFSTAPPLDFPGECTIAVRSMSPLPLPLMPSVDLLPADGTKEPRQKELEKAHRQDLLQHQQVALTEESRRARQEQDLADVHDAVIAQECRAPLQDNLVASPTQLPLATPTPLPPPSCAQQSLEATEATEALESIEAQQALQAHTFMAIQVEQAAPIQQLTGDAHHMLHTTCPHTLETASLRITAAGCTQADDLLEPPDVASNYQGASNDLLNTAQHEILQATCLHTLEAACLCIAAGACTQEDDLLGPFEVASDHQFASKDLLNSAQHDSNHMFKPATNQDIIMFKSATSAACVQTHRPLQVLMPEIDKWIDASCAALDDDVALDADGLVHLPYVPLFPHSLVRLHHHAKEAEEEESEVESEEEELEDDDDGEREVGFDGSPSFEMAHRRGVVDDTDSRGVVDGAYATDMVDGFHSRSMVHDTYSRGVVDGTDCRGMMHDLPHSKAIGNDFDGSPSYEMAHRTGMVDGAQSKGMVHDTVCRGMEDDLPHPRAIVNDFVAVAQERREELLAAVGKEGGGRVPALCLLSGAGPRLQHVADLLLVRLHARACIHLLSHTHAHIHQISHTFVLHICFKSFRKD